METQQPTARILPFRRPATAETETGAALGNALAGLDAALATQRIAVETWRASLDALGARTTRLRHSAGGLQDALARLAMQGERLREVSRRLAERTAG